MTYGVSSLSHELTKDPVSCPHGQAMGCLLWVFRKKLVALSRITWYSPSVFPVPVVCISLLHNHRGSTTRSYTQAEIGKQNICKRFLRTFLWTIIKKEQNRNYKSLLSAINKLTHSGRDKMAASFQMTISNVFPLMKIYKFRLMFHWSLLQTRWQAIIWTNDG